MQPADIAAQCARELGERLWQTSVSQMRTTITRRWALCTPTGVFHDEAEAGLVIDADGRFALLAWSEDGLIRKRGLENQGSIRLVDTSAMNGRPTIQVDFQFDSGGTMPTVPIISDEPRVLIMHPGGGDEMRYVPLP